MLNMRNKFQNFIEHPEKEIHILRKELDELKRMYRKKNMEWEEKLEDSTKELKENIQNEQKEVLLNLLNTQNGNIFLCF